MKNYYRDADDEGLTRAYNNAVRAITNNTVALKRQRYEQLLSAVEAYQKSQIDLAQAGQPANLTFLITNSSFTRYNIGWQGAEIPAVRTTADVMATYVGYENETAEQFSRSFDIWQELLHMPRGTYTLTANAFYRAGAISDAYNAWQAESPSIMNAQLYLGNASTAIMNLYSSDAYTYSPYNYPDNLSSASTAFNTHDRYADNSVTFTLATDDSPLRLGIRKLNTIDADWVAYDHFQLHYLGDATAIRLIDNLTPALSQGEGAIYNVQGQRLNSLQRGINIVDNKKIFIK